MRLLQLLRLKKESKCIDGASEGVQVDAVQGGRRARGGRRAGGWRGAGGARAARAPLVACERCGSVRCLGGERCPACDVKCYVCEKKGHFSRVCKHTKSIRKVLNLSVETVNSDSDEESQKQRFYINTLDNKKKQCKSPLEWTEIIECQGKKLLLKIDTGSMINVISKVNYMKLGLSITDLKPFTKRVYSFTGNQLSIIGIGKISFMFRKTSYVLSFVVVDLFCQSVLGLEGCIALGLINQINTINLDNYNELFQGLGKLPGKYSIVIDKNVQPVICPTRKIPFGLKDKLKEELCRMEDLGVVRKVTHPTSWVNAIVLVAKKDGSIRVCLDPRPLNRAVQRAQYSLPTVPELAARLRGATVFSVLDARCGFWMVQIDDVSADLCTFGTPFGRYQFLRLPYGINCAPEVFHAKLRQHLENLEGVESFIDDIIVWGRSKDEHNQRLECLLRRAKDIGIKFNREKCKFGVSEITYLGHKFDANGMRADDSKVKAIMDMPYPTDRKALERFLGMVNYLAKFIPNYSESVNVLRSLLKKDSEWSWESQHSEAVDRLKAKLGSAPVLALYSDSAPLVVSVDASSVALGAVLLQNDRPVEFASLTLTDTQTRYAQIEKEMLAIVFGIERFKQYIYGRTDVTVNTDHKPLEALFNKPLVSVPVRLQRMMLRVQGYDFKVVYTPGKNMYIADTLSRAPLKEKMHDQVSTEVEIQTCFMLEHVPFSQPRLEAIQKETDLDSDCRWLIKYITKGWPKNRRDVNERVNAFWPYHEQMHYVDGIIFKDELVFIPRALREDMLSRVHEGHLGIERCKRRARDVMFWPGMCDDVERIVRTCAACALHAPRPRRQPLLQHSVPALPWHKLASDTFEYKKKNYIVLVDYFSNYVEVGQLTSISSKQVISFMKEQFARHGIPAELVSDNGPAYNSQEFKKFMREWEIQHVTSSPHYPQSNGKSERTVQTVKNMLKKCVDSGQDFNLALLNFRTTPRHDLDSPAQILMGRRLKTRLPVCTKLLTERVDNEKNYKAILSKREQIKINYDKSANTLKRLSQGDRATLVCNGARKPVTVVAQAAQPRSYIVEDERGGRYRRTRSQLITRTASSAEIIRETVRQPSDNEFSCKLPSVISMAGYRRRRRKPESTGSQNTVVPTRAQASPANSEYHESPVGSRDQSCTSSPHEIPIERSKERTARMLNHLFQYNE
ncbi:uncharacterized protein K02A2.6-like [Spodoptera litura]|uniref:RNA-directed DNA polymerase n=1 Tax=Spodoptera litura TaxID=69820 RepID=A0A9J7DUK4_SPOLT|nr:uncharacterized protein K02A2.6-like [Spodoptera litura]